MPIFAADVFNSRARRARPDVVRRRCRRHPRRDRCGVGDAIRSQRAAAVLALIAFAASLFGFAVSPSISFAVVFARARGHRRDGSPHHPRDDAADVRTGAHAGPRREPAAGVSRIHLRWRARVRRRCQLVRRAIVVVLFVTLSLVVIGAAWARSAALRDVTLSRLIGSEKRVKRGIDKAAAIAPLDQPDAALRPARSVGGP